MAAKRRNEAASWRVKFATERSSEEVPIPYARHLEQAALPQVPKIVAAVRRIMGR